MLMVKKGPGKAAGYNDAHGFSRLCCVDDRSSKIGGTPRLTLQEEGTVLRNVKRLVLMLVVGIGAGMTWLIWEPRADQPKNARPSISEGAAAPVVTNSVALNDTQLKRVKVESVQERLFEITHATVGNIDFNQDNSVQVFTPYPGRITKLLAKAGDDVRKDQDLFYIDSPDLSTAEGTLIQAAAQLELTSKALKRAQELFAAKGAAQKDVEQATSDHKTAEGTYNAARNAVRIFGKTDAEMDKVLSRFPA